MAEFDHKAFAKQMAPFYRKDKDKEDALTQTQELESLLLKVINKEPLTSADSLKISLYSKDAKTRKQYTPGVLRPPPEPPKIKQGVSAEEYAQGIAEHQLAKLIEELILQTAKAQKKDPNSPQYKRLQERLDVYRSVYNSKFSVPYQSQQQSQQTISTPTQNVPPPPRVAVRQQTQDDKRWIRNKANHFQTSQGLDRAQSQKKAEELWEQLIRGTYHIVIDSKLAQQFNLPEGSKWQYVSGDPRKFPKNYKEI